MWEARSIAGVKGAEGVEDPGQGGHADRDASNRRRRAKRQQRRINAMYAGVAVLVVAVLVSVALVQDAREDDGPSAPQAPADLCDELGRARIEEWVPEPVILPSSGSDGPEARAGCLAVTNAGEAAGLEFVGALQVDLVRYPADAEAEVTARYDKACGEADDTTEEACTPVDRFVENGGERVKVVVRDGLDLVEAQYTVTPATRGDARPVVEAVLAGVLDAR